MALTGLELVDVGGVQPNGMPSPLRDPVPVSQIAALGIVQRGTFVVTGTVPVTVAFPGLTRTMVITCSLNTVGGTVGAIPAIQTVTPGTGFTVAGSTNDGSTYNWIAE